MTTAEVVLAELRNWYVVRPGRDGTEKLADAITRKVLEHLHETGALSCPPEDLD
jgi:hypothetical protein